MPVTQGRPVQRTRAAVRSAAVLCCLGLLVTACGNRLSTREILAQNTVSGSGTRSNTPGGATPTAGGGNGSQQAGSGTNSTSGTGGNTAGGELGGDSGTGEGATGTGTAAGSGAPLVIGFVGWLSGIGGAATSLERDAVVAWQKSVNARGGINGHPVDLIVGDTGGNDSRALSVVRDFVENQGAVAIIFVSTSLGGIADYAREHSIPVIGGIVVDPAWNQNPMLFPPIANLDGNAYGRAQLAKLAGITKVGTMYCSEDAACQQGNDIFAKYASELGLQVVYQGRVSIAQPDFTAECLQARGRGAQLIFPLADQPSVVRMAQSCDRQNYDPVWTTGGSDAMLQVPAFNSALLAPPGFPWFLRSGAPGIDEYVQALSTYAPHLLSGQGIDGQAWSWIAAKVVETAAAKGLSDKPTSQDILNGLWSMQGETLNGLLQGGSALTFTRDQPTPEKFCVAQARIQDGQFIAPDGLTPTCK